MPRHLLQLSNRDRFAVDMAQNERLFCAKFEGLDDPDGEGRVGPWNGLVGERI